ncbi:ABC transporter permease [Mycolicibacterium obuense]|uniref:Putative D,D-dipeptide transport system permease protein DdpC n=1 Tax=Mycolicibacterium obuense TaxID=1807 RepID=A0A0J6VGZ7_9MYCO|nr:ABC transporter permease [Mycolicibacterium obuense]KMO68877.1 putative D,D-dipeptide transport system permease protein DdpC [Mycolicibacterium obuense]
MSQAVLTAPALRAASPSHPLRRITRLTDRLGPLGTTAAITLTVIVLAAAAAPLIAPFDPNEPDLLNVLSNPTTTHWLGTDALGRDIFSRLLFGTRYTLAGPGLVILLSTVVGSMLALTAAWWGGRVDTAISWVLDVLFAVPGIVFALIAVALFGPSFGTVVAGLTIAYIPYVARVVRGAALRERNLPYVSAAWLQGQRSLSITTWQMLPNLMPLIVAQAVSSLGFAVIDLAAVSFLGLGVQPPTADLGLMVKSGFDSVLRGFFSESQAAGTLIVLIVLCVTVIGDRLTASARSGQ